MTEHNTEPMTEPNDNRQDDDLLSGDPNDRSKGHLDDEAVFLWLEDSGTRKERTGWEEHLAACKACRGRVAETEHSLRVTGAAVAAALEETTPSERMNFSQISPDRETPGKETGNRLTWKPAWKLVAAGGAVALLALLFYGVWSWVVDPGKGDEAAPHGVEAVEAEDGSVRPDKSPEERAEEGLVTSGEHGESRASGEKGSLEQPLDEPLPAPEEYGFDEPAALGELAVEVTEEASEVLNAEEEPRAVRKRRRSEMDNPPASTSVDVPIECPGDTREVVGNKQSAGWVFAGCERPDGTLHGPWVTWHGNKVGGPVRSEGAYENGQRTGHWSYWAPEGWKEEGGRYVSDQRAGVWLSWDADGKRLAEVVYRDGEPLSEQESETNSGVIPSDEQSFVTTAELVASNGLSCSDGGTLRMTSTADEHAAWCEKDGSVDGWRVVWSPSGTVRAESEYHHGQRHGVHQEFYPGGGLAVVEHYAEGELDGVRTTFYPEGGKATETEYSAGKRNGLHLRWFESGKPGLEAHYQSGLLHGRETHWYENGHKSFEGNWHQGRKSGRHAMWHADGALRGECVYAANVVVSCQFADE